MIEPLKNDIRQRVTDGLTHFSRICSTRDGRSILRAKGLAFVEMYAIHEYAITNAVRIGVSIVSGHAIKIGELRAGILALAADDRLKSVQSSPLKTQWTARLKLFSWVKSATTAEMNQQVFPVDGSHYKLQQLETIWQIFGLTGRAVPDKRLLQLVDEVVNHRNAVAHGRETPEEVGRLYTADEIRKKFTQVSRIAIHVITKLGDQCSDSSRLRH